MTYGSSLFGGSPIGASEEAKPAPSPYVRPDGTAVNASWAGANPYTLPAGTNADAAWSLPPASGVFGVGEGTISVTLEGTATHFNPVSGIGYGAIDCTGSGTAAHGVAGVGAGAINCTGSGTAVHGVAGVASGSLSLAGAGTAVHERYEVRGEVREGGVLVNRRVRAYLRSSGALVSETDTVGGKFNLNTGFSQAEHYVVPIDLGAFASDWLPPAANRIVPVLAYDLA